MSKNGFTITRLSVFRYLGISEWVMTKPGQFNLIKGKNAAGKSSILKAIKETISPSGTKGVAQYLIHKGENDAELLMELSGNIEITRTITPESNTVNVVSDGEPLTSPQAFLNNLLGGAKLEFNPVAFYRAKKPQRREMILKAIEFKMTAKTLKRFLVNSGCNIDPIDFDEYDYDQHGLTLLESVRKTIYDLRQEQGRTVLRITKSIELDEKEFPESFDPEAFRGFDLSVRLTDLTKAQAIQTGHENDITEVKNLRQERDRRKNEITESINSLPKKAQTIKEIESEILEKQKQIETIQQEFKQTETKIENLESDYDNFANDANALVEKVGIYEKPDIEGIQNEIDEFNKNQKLIIKREAIEERKIKLETEKEKHSELEVLHTKIKKDAQRKILNEVDLPIQGLQITDDEVFLDEKPIENLCTSEQATFAVNMAMALSGDLRIICMDQIECLDPDTFSDFVKVCSKNKDYQYFVTKVTSGPLNVETETMNLIGGDLESKDETKSDLPPSGDNEVIEPPMPNGLDDKEQALFYCLHANPEAIAIWNECREYETIPDDTLRSDLLRVWKNPVDLADGHDCKFHAKGGKIPRFWYDIGNDAPSKVKPTYAGKILLEKVRFVLELPQFGSSGTNKKEF